jgi:hypothetical protein
MPTRKKLARKVPRFVALTEAQLHLLKTGEEIDFSVWEDAEGDNARGMFESVRGDFAAGTFPWAEQRFGREG